MRRVQAAIRILGRPGGARDSSVHMVDWDSAQPMLREQQSVLKRLANRILRRPANLQPVGGEGPRGYVGGLWYTMGEMQFKFLVERGLLPDHTLLDIACGSLRLGIRVIPYLGTGNYLGIDIRGDLIEHGKTIELGSTLCRLKQPEFVVSESFEFAKFSKKPDIAVAQSLFSHLIAQDIALCLTNLAAHRKEGTVLYATAPRR
ncbi:MAG: class I SAM-dependent methyltransferase [Acetobacteraceae bacterium]